MSLSCVIKQKYQKVRNDDKQQALQQGAWVSLSAGQRVDIEESACPNRHAKARQESELSTTKAREEARETSKKAVATDA